MKNPTPYEKELRQKMLQIFRCFNSTVILLTP